MKQAYSAYVTPAPNARPRKWHLTAYFTYADLPSIPTVDSDPLLNTITVPSGVYRSSKARSRHSDASLSAPGSASPPAGTAMLPSPTASPGVPSRPSSPAIHHHHRGGVVGGAAVVLPSLHSAIASTPMGFGGSHHRAVPRIAEDQRMIQMLNARPI